MSTPKVMNNRRPSRHKFDFAKRHPLCPSCGYDLIATVDAKGRRCPECGEDFEIHELIRQILPGDWTVWRGIRRVLVVLGLKSLIAFVLWTLLFCSAGMVLTAVPWSSWLFIAVALILVIPGVLLGAFLSHKLEEHAGCVSFLFTAIAMVFVWMIVIGGAEAGSWFRMLPSMRTGIIAMIVGVIASGWILKVTWLDEL